MGGSQGWTLSADEILALPLDEFALRLLADIDANEGNPNGYSWMNRARQHYGRNSPAMTAMAEAWNWLESRGLIAPDLSQSSSNWVFITRLGRPQFLLGKYDLAVFAAFKAIEVRVRALSGASDSDIGVKLMRSAFGDNGPLRDNDMDRGESVALMELFAGAIGLFKNPTSHRVVTYDDPVEAAEAIFFADLLMRVLDGLEAF